MIAASSRLRKHREYQSVYSASRKQFGKQMSYFFTLRPLLGPDGNAIGSIYPTGPRIGFTVPKALGKAVDRNRIKRRLRAAVRRQLSLLSQPVDVILHPRRSVIDLEFVALEREVATILRTIQKSSLRQASSSPGAADSAAK